MEGPKAKGYTQWHPHPKLEKDRLRRCKLGQLGTFAGLRAKLGLRTHFEAVDAQAVVSQGLVFWMPENSVGEASSIIYSHPSMFNIVTPQILEHIGTRNDQIQYKSMVSGVFILRWKG